MKRGKEERSEGEEGRSEEGEEEGSEEGKEAREGARKERKEEALTSKCNSIPSIINSQCSPPMAIEVSPTERL